MYTSPVSHRSARQSAIQVSCPHTISMEALSICSATSSLASSDVSPRKFCVANVHLTESLFSFFFLSTQSILHSILSIFTSSLSALSLSPTGGGVCGGVVVGAFRHNPVSSGPLVGVLSCIVIELLSCCRCMEGGGNFRPAVPSCSCPCVLIVAASTSPLLFC